VIVNKGTEAPFSGEYDNFFGAGVYTCKRCGAMLYRSEDKFDAHCGWPAFDDAFPGAIKRVPDPDGQRTEIECANCGAHLGHVLEGEELTAKNTRYCVNSISMLFVPLEQVKYGRAIFAGGCFWGVQYQLSCVPGVLKTTAGYTGGHVDHPTYEQVCSHTTGHAEAVEVIYDPVRVSYETLAKVFFEIHDPTQVGGQGPDLGSNYRSAIFYTSDDQKLVAEKLIADLTGRGMKIATEVTAAGPFWPAEAYHQDYYKKQGVEAACHVRQKLW
jgi:peptide methionine sulfoxide reductase msrA/msrB